MEIEGRKRNKNNSMLQCFNMMCTVKTRKQAFSGVRYASRRRNLNLSLTLVGFVTPLLIMTNGLRLLVSCEKLANRKNFNFKVKIYSVLRGKMRHKC